MKPAERRAFFQDLKDRGYIEHENVWYPPAQFEALGIVKVPAKKKRAKYKRTGDIDDELNIKNKLSIRDTFIMLTEKEGLDTWPEFYFTTQRMYRIDYCWPEYKVALEVNGGIHMQRGGHNTAAGLQRDYEKNNLLQSLGWKTIAVTPDQMFSNETIKLIKSMIEGQKNRG